MSFKILYHEDFLKKDLPQLDQSIQRRVKLAIEAKLTTAPMDYGKPLGSTLKGIWSLRVADKYRIGYVIKEKEVWVLRVAHREKIYLLLVKMAKELVHRKLKK